MSGGRSVRFGRLAQENLVCLALVAIFAGVVWLCQEFGPRARMIPLPLAIGGIVLTLVQLAWQNLRSTDELKMDWVDVAARAPADSGAATAPGAGTVETGSGAGLWGRELRALGIVAALIALTLTIGIVPAVFAFTASYFLLTRQYSLRAALVYTGVFTAVVHLLFIEALQIQPYHGLLEPLVERFR